MLPSDRPASVLLLEISSLSCWWAGIVLYAQSLADILGFDGCLPVFSFGKWRLSFPTEQLEMNKCSPSSSLLKVQAALGWYHPKDVRGSGCLASGSTQAFGNCFLIFSTFYSCWNVLSCLCLFAALKRMHCPLLPVAFPHQYWWLQVAIRLPETYELFSLFPLVRGAVTTSTVLGHWLPLFFLRLLDC